VTGCHIVLRGHWGDNIALSARSPTEDKINSSKDGFCEELEQVVSQFPKYHMKILLGHLSVDLGGESIFQPIKLSGVQCSQIRTFMNVLGRLLMGRLTIRLITS
jgi:hypothetical protein